MTYNPTEDLYIGLWEDKKDDVPEEIEEAHDEQIKELIAEIEEALDAIEYGNDEWGGIF